MFTDGMATDLLGNLIIGLVVSTAVSYAAIAWLSNTCKAIRPGFLVAYRFIFGAAA